MIKQTPSWATLLPGSGKSRAGSEFVIEQPAFTPSLRSSVMTTTSSSFFLLVPDVSVDVPVDASLGSAAPHTGTALDTVFDPIALIRDVTAGLLRSTEPEIVFGSLVTAYEAHSATQCTVELLAGTAVRTIQAPSPAGGDPIVTEQQSLSPGARQLLSGNGEPLVGADWFSLPIGAAACRAGDAEVPIGAFTCRFVNHRVDSAHLQPAQFLIALATELLQAERRLAKSQDQVANLEIALASNRDIGTAIGILMIAHLATQEEAFTMLRTASQHGHRKLREIANDVIFTGSLGTAALRG